MVKAATEGNDAFEVSELEVEREGLSYTVDTIRRLRSSDPDSRLFLIVGADQLAEFHEWREPEAIARMATVVAVPRNGKRPGDMPPVDLGGGRMLELLWLQMERMDHSSSDIRRRVREGRSIRYLVPAAVKKIIENHRLYRPI
jgi:nicotinate-nucleotide adenylyltransferase